MADFTIEEISKIKKQLSLTDLYDQRDDLQSKKTQKIGVIKQKASVDIDAINDDYNPRIEALNTQIRNSKEA